MALAMPCAPDLTGRIVAIDIRAVQFWDFVAVVHDAAGQGTKLRVMMLNRRWHDWGRAPLSVGIERVVSFVHTPTKVIATPHQIGGFPQVLTVVPDPHVAGLH